MAGLPIGRKKPFRLRLRKLARLRVDFARSSFQGNGLHPGYVR